MSKQNVSGKSPLVSVIIPTHNRADMLCWAVNSVLNQSCTDFEVIVVDDGSTDDTQQRIEAYTDPRIRYVKHDESKGAAAARNTGIRQARGRYIAFLDDDDEWLPTKLEKQVPLLQQATKQVGLVYCWMDYYRDGRLIIEHHPTLRGHVFDQVLDRQRLGGCPTLLVRWEVVEDVGGFDESLPRGNDGDFIRRVCRKYQVDFVPEVLVHVHVGHSGRITSESDQGLRNQITGGETKLHKFAYELERLPQAHASILHQLALAHLKLGEYRWAEYYLRQAVLTTPRNVRLYRDWLLVIWRGISRRGGNAIRAGYSFLPSPLHRFAQGMRQEYRYSRSVRIPVLKRHVRETWAALHSVRFDKISRKPQVVYMTGMPRTGTSLAKNYLGSYPGLKVMKFQKGGFMYAWRAAEQTDAIVIDKATHYIRGLRKIHRAYGDHVAFYCLIRDPRDELASLLETSMHREVYRDERFWKQWARTYNDYLEFAASLAKPKACYLIRYEDLVRWPVEAKISFLTWLGLDTNPGTVTAEYDVVHEDDIQDSKLRARRKVTPHSVGRWGEVRNSQAQALSRQWQHVDEARALMRSVGYTEGGVADCLLKLAGLTVFQPQVLQEES